MFLGVTKWNHKPIQICSTEEKKLSFLPQGGKMDAGVACGNAMETSNGGKLK
jgi:hypothetical protein